MSSVASMTIFRAVKSGQIESRQFILAQGSRLDVVAYDAYGSADLWWVIASASGIGWQCQVPAGTVLQIPTSINAVADLVG